MSGDDDTAGGGAGTGMVEMRDPSGRVVRRVGMRGDRPDGELVEFDAAGRPVVRLTFRDGVLHGPAVLLRDGAVRTEMTYADGKLDGELRSFDSGGRLLAVLRYVAGRREGIMEIFGPGGRIVRTEAWRDDRLDGEVAEFLDDGTPARRSQYRDGLPDGESVTYDADGRPATRQVFVGGVAAGQPEPVAGPAEGLGSRLGRLFKR